jgi:hypothetical protein
MTPEEATYGISTAPEQIIAKNRPSSNYVFKGVEIVNPTLYKISSEGDEQ